MFKVIASLISIVVATEKPNPCITYTTDAKTGKKVAHDDW